MPLQAKIERFVQGDEVRTAWSAEVLNEIVDSLNAVLAMEGRGGLKVTKSDAKFVLEFSGSAASSDEDGGNGGNTEGNTTIVSGSVMCLCRWA